MKLNWEKISYIFQIPLQWFRDADRRLNIFGDGQIVRVNRNNPDGTYITIDPDAVRKALEFTEDTFSASFPEVPSTNDNTVSTGHNYNALLTTTWTRAGATEGIKLYLPTDSWGDGVSRSTAWRLCEFDRYGGLQKVYAQTIRTECALV